MADFADLLYFSLFFLVVKNFQEKHPDELGEPLGIAVHARVFAHDVLDIFDD